MNDIDNLDSFIEGLEIAAAMQLQRAALELQQHLTARLRQNSNPPPYKNPAPRGTYPHVRTGFLASHILIRPASLTAIRSAGLVRVGYGASAFYGVALGNRGWKWLADALEEATPQIQAALGSAGNYKLIT